MQLYQTLSLFIYIYSSIYTIFNADDLIFIYKT